MSIPNPRLLRTGETLIPTGLEVTLATDELPQVRITLAEDPGVLLHDLIEIHTAQGSAGLFRVTDRSKAYEDEIALSCRGALDTLSDDVYPGTTAVSGTVSAVIASILSKQSTAKWQLGSCAMTGSVKIENSYTNLLDLMEAVRKQHPGYWWTYNYATTPWTVNLAALPDTTAAEFRLGRNVSSATIDLSDAEMCTKLYMTVTDGSTSTLYTFDDASAQAEWGVITKTVDVSADDLPGTPAEYAAEILAQRGKPVAFITLDGYDLKRLTGDDFDRITLGSNCQVVLEGFEGFFTERVTRIRWPDALDEPDRITVSLANNLAPFREQLNLIKKTGGGAAKKAAENERELIIQKADIEKSNERILLWATEEQWDEIAEEYQLTHESQFELTAREITSVVKQTGVTQGVNTFSPDVSYSAGDRCIYGGSVYQFTSAHSGAWTGTDVTLVPSMQSQITQNATAITFKVSQGDVATQLAVECGNVTITGGDLILEGALIASNGVVSYNGTITADTLEARFGEIDTVSALTVSAGSFSGADSYTMDSYGGDLVDGIKDVQIIAVSGTNNYKLQYKTFSGNTWTDAGTFSRATALTGAWNSGILTVTASPQDEHYYDYLGVGTIARSGVDYTIPVTHCTDPNGVFSTVYTISLSAQEVWDDGYTAGGGGVVVTPQISTSWGTGAQTGRLYITTTPTPASTVEYWFSKGTVTWNGNTASVPITTAPSQQGSATARFNVTVDASSVVAAGVNDALAAVTLTKGSWSSGGVTVSNSANASTESISLTADSTTWSGNVGSRVIKDGTTDTGLTVTVDATSKINAALSGVTLTKTWGTGAQTGILTVSNSANSSTANVTLSRGTVTWSGSTGTVPVLDNNTQVTTFSVTAPAVSISSVSVGAISGSSYNASLGYWTGSATVSVTMSNGESDSQTATVNVQEAINAAAGPVWADAASRTVWPSESTNSSFTVTVPASTWGTTTSKTFTLSVDSGYVYANDGTNNVARSAYISKTVSNSVSSIGTNRGNRTSAGSISKSGLVANTYLGFSIRAAGVTTYYYITVNA